MPALFLDRDGVINCRIPGAYVQNVAEFMPEKQAYEAIVRLSARFYPIVVVTNQAGIGKELMTEEDLSEVHRAMIQGVFEAGGRIDLVLHCPHHPKSGCPCRKPASGMAEMAQRIFPELDLSTATMVGDSASDMEFAKHAGIGHRILIAGKTEDAEKLSKMELSEVYASLWDWVDGFDS